jgi:hypothetical protein
MRCDADLWLAGSRQEARRAARIRLESLTHQNTNSNNNNMSADPMQTDPAPADQPAAPQQQTYRQIAAAHIHALNNINAELPRILVHFASAMTQLTNNPIPKQERPDGDSLQARQDDLRYFAYVTRRLVELLRADLVSQINDLEHYKVIPAKHQKFTPVQTDEHDTQQRDPEAGVKNGGYGDFDVGVLNARVASGQIGGDDVLERVRGVLDELLRRGRDDANGEEMAVDG